MPIDLRGLGLARYTSARPPRTLDGINPMQGYDILMLIVLIAATAWGAHKGLAWQIASLASIVVSYFVALRFRESAAQMIPAESPWNRFLGMLVVYLACSLGIWIAFRFVSEMIDRVKLKEFDRQIGGLVGFAKGVVLCVIITLFAVTLSGESTRQQIIHSKSGRYISTLLSKSYSWIPPEARQVVTPYLDQWNRQLRGEGGPMVETDPRSPGSWGNDDDRSWDLEDARERLGSLPDEPQPPRTRDVRLLERARRLLDPVEQ